MNIVILAIALLAALSSEARAEGECVGYYRYFFKGSTDPFPKKPFGQRLEQTSSARSCLLQCKEDRIVRMQEKRYTYNKIEYSCRYNDKVIHNVSQVIH